MSKVKRKLGFHALARYWLSSNAMHLGVPLMIFGVVALIAIIAIPLLPTGPVREMVGEVKGMGFQENDEGSFTSASVQVENRVVRVRLPTRHDCRVGDQIKLRERPTRWGYATGVAMERWPCSR